MTSKKELTTKEDLDSLVVNLCTVLNGKQPCDELAQRLQAGSSFITGLYRIDPGAAYVALAASLYEAQEYLPRGSPGKEALGHLANYFAEKVGYDFSKGSKPYHGGIKK